MKSTMSILNLQEIIKKIKCNTLISSAVLEFKDGIVSSRGIGLQDKLGKVDGSFHYLIQQPAVIQEDGEICIGDLSSLLSKSEIFEKEDQVELGINEKNQLTIKREIPIQNLGYDLADKKFILTAYKGSQNLAYGNPCVWTTSKGKEQKYEFTTEVVLDSSQLKSFADAASKIAPAKVPLQVKDGVFHSAVKGEGTDLMREIKTDKVEGNALSKYRIELLEIFKMGFGLATIRFSDNAPIYIHYKLNNQKADYLLAQS